MMSIYEHEASEPPDIHSATDDYARRFAGKTGEWLLSIQTCALLRMLASFPSSVNVLDIGGGHGQIAAPLAEHGYSVTVTGSSMACRTRVNDLLEASEGRFQIANLLDLPFADRSFDVVTCFRMLTHVSDWKRLLAEMSRVARTAVVIDYPSLRSVNALTPIFFSLKQRTEGNTRTYQCFEEKDLLCEFSRNGFVLQERYAQFFFPMVLHRKFGHSRVSTALENAAQWLGLSDQWGSPVILKVMRETR